MRKNKLHLCSSKLVEEETGYEALPRFATEKHKELTYSEPNICRSK